MPRFISLAAYAVKVWNPNDREYEVVSDFDGDGADLLDFLNNVLQGIKNKTLDQEGLQQAIAIPKLETKHRALLGIIDTGQYGHESDFINVKTTKVVYKRTKNDAQMFGGVIYSNVTTNAGCKQR